MSVTSRSQIAKELRPGLEAVFGRSYGAVPEDHKTLFDEVKSNKAYEESVMLANLTVAPVKSEGAAVDFDNFQETYSVRLVNETVALGFAVTEEAMEDNLYLSMARDGTKMLGRSMGTTKQIKAANVFNNGFSTSFPGGDGVPLFTASHPTLSGNQSNFTNTDLSESALENAEIAIMKFKDEKGLFINAVAQSLHVPVELKFTAYKILQSQLSTTTVTNSTTGVTNVNDVNALRAMGSYPKGCQTNRRFTDTDAWFIRTDVEDGLVYYNRAPVKFSMEEDFVTGNTLHKARERYVFGWRDWRSAYGSQGNG